MIGNLKRFVTTVAKELNWCRQSLLTPIDWKRLEVTLTRSMRTLVANPW